MKANENIASEIKNHLENLEFDFIDNEILEDIQDFFEGKYAKQSAVESLEDSANVSQEELISFLESHGIKIKPNIKELKSEYLSKNFKRVKFSGVEYYLRIKDYGEEQNVFEFLIDKHIVSVAA